MSDTIISFPFLGGNFSINPPSYITILGHDIYLYGIVIAIGFILAAVYMSKRSKVFGLTEDNIIDILLCAVPLGIVGARLYYVAFRPDIYFGAGKWGNIVKIWEGGLAIYGGIIFGVLGIFLYCRKKKIPFGTALDIAAFGVLIGQIMGRWGNFFNREAYGAETDSFFRMGLTKLGQTVYVHPTFLYESVWNLAGLVFLHFYSKKHRKFDGQIFLMYVAWYGLGRFWIEGLRSDSLYIWNSGLRVSQLVAAVSFIIATVLIITIMKKVKASGKKMYVDRISETPNSETSETLPAETVTTEAEEEYICEEDKNLENIDKTEV